MPTPEENNAISRVVAPDDADGAAAAADDDDDAPTTPRRGRRPRGRARAPAAAREMGEAAPTVRRSARAHMPAVRIGAFVYQGE